MSTPEAEEISPESVVSPMIGRRVLRGQPAIFERPIDIIGAERIAVMAHIIIQTSRREYEQLTVLRGNTRQSSVPTLSPWIYVANKTSFRRLAYGEVFLHEIANTPDLPLSSGGSGIPIGSIAKHKHVLGKSGYVAPIHVGVWIPQGKYQTVAIDDQSGDNRETVVYADWANVFANSPVVETPDVELNNIIEFPELKAN